MASATGLKRGNEESTAAAASRSTFLQAGGEARDARMNVVFVTSEAVPFAKTGGLADVCGALPMALAKAGHEVTVVMPAYRQAGLSRQTIQATAFRVDVPIGDRLVSGRVLESRLPGSNVRVFLLEQDEYYNRSQLYRENGEDYKDNCERFVYLCRGALEALRLLRITPDVIHCHDWQTGLIPALLKIEYRHARAYQNIASVFTIHNLAYQGRFWHWDMLLTGLDWRYFNWRQMEFWGDLCLLKTGLVFADQLTTVSPSYAREIQTAEQGCGLDGLLRERAADLAGIVNGVDYEVWNSAQDPFIAQSFDVKTWRKGKAICKSALQRELNLPLEQRVPLIGLVGRFVDQKGWDLVARLIENWAAREAVQWAVLGTGEAVYQDLLTRLAREFPTRVAVRLDFSEPLAHQIESGVDMFLMPSRFEPCGLNQLYSLRYGSVPVVRATGGLADTVVDTTPATLASGQATGFRFEDYELESLEAVMNRARLFYERRPDDWGRIVETGMRQDWSWDRSAAQYGEVYRRAIERHRETGTAN